MKIAVLGLFSLGGRWRSRLGSSAVVFGLGPPNRPLGWRLVLEIKGLWGWWVGVAE